MASYNSKDIVIAQRNDANSSFEERVFSVQSQSIVFIDSNKNLVCVPTSSFFQSIPFPTSSISASYSINSNTASWAQTASYAMNDGGGITDIDGGNASTVYTGVIQSPLFGGNA